MEKYYKDIVYVVGFVIVGAMIAYNYNEYTKEQFGLLQIEQLTKSEAELGRKLDETQATINVLSGELTKNIETKNTLISSIKNNQEKQKQIKTAILYLKKATGVHTGSDQ